MINFMRKTALVSLTLSTFLLAGCSTEFMNAFTSEVNRINNKLNSEEVKNSNAITVKEKVTVRKKTITDKTYGYGQNIMMSEDMMSNDQHNHMMDHGMMNMMMSEDMMSNSQHNVKQNNHMN